MDSYLAYEDLFKKMYQAINAKKQEIIITPNHRLSTTLAKQYQQFLSSQHYRFWETPKIIPLSSFIKIIWNEISLYDMSLPTLLNSVQTNFIWNNIIKSDCEDLTLSTHETAHIAVKSWRKIQIWNIDLNHPDFDSSQDYLSFKQWAKSFIKICENKNWIDEASLLNKISRLLLHSTNLPKKIYLVGFTEYTPQLKIFLEHCKHNGLLIELFTLNNKNQTTQRITIHDREQEIISAARFALKKISENSNLKIACVIPNLETCRDRVEQLFHYVFRKKNHHLINISAGKVLTQHSIISIIFNIINLLSKQITLDEFNKIFLSPFIGQANKESYKRAKYIHQLKKCNVIKMTLKEMIHDEDKRFNDFKQSCPYFFKRLQQLAKYVTDNELQESTCDHWAQYINTILSILGWPGELSLESNEYQIVEQWLTMIESFKSLDYIAPVIKPFQAFYTLQRIASQTMVQPKSPDTPIQILGTLEAAGQTFDYLWICGMDDLAWPPQPKPDPFIPRTMQQNLQISHATAEREYEFCKKLQQQLISHSTHVYFSHAECRDDIELNASPLIKNIPELTHDELDLSLFYLPNFEIFQSRSYQFINDEIAPNVTIGEQIPGGIQIIKNQAMCPFKAFATHRLLTKSPEKTSIGIKKSDKGKLIHLILELFWKEIVNQDQLLKMSTVECEKLLETHIQTAFKSLNLDHQDQKKLLTLESFRIKTILLEWLNIEKQREPFKVVDLEIKNNIQISKISIETRIDRIDQLSDLSFLVIDYKSGKYNDISNWFGDRPDDPQLPCYATFTNHAIHGLAYAQVTSNQSGFKGIHQQPVRVKGIKTINEVKHTNAVSWLEQQNLWRTHIEKISDEFIAGYAHVDPKNKNVTCDQCHLHPLCRIKEKLNEYE